MNRSSGVLLHITSLPDGEGIGDLGESARDFIDWLVIAEQTWWQVLPCGEVGFGESPYQSRSAYAGNPWLISLESLVKDDLLDADALPVAELRATDASAAGSVDFPAVSALKDQVLATVSNAFFSRASDTLQKSFHEFEAAPEQHWLQDYARFVVLKQRFSDLPWTEWPREFVEREAQAMAELDERSGDALQAVKVTQFLFARQWQSLLEYAHSCGVRLLGDCPIYVAADSADVWCNRNLFDLNEDGTPRVVAGVPPDYFAATGQLWGNPLYLWDRAMAEDFAWWRARIKHGARHFDLIRIDHFRGLEAYWEVPGDAPDASGGVWQQGPGDAFLNALKKDYEVLPLVAEDLGDLTEEVHLLREKFELPGMRVLQFGFDGGDDNPHALERIVEDCICYAGTHDNNTTLGWIRELSGEQRQTLCSQLGFEDNETTDIELLTSVLDQVLAGPARLAVLSMQDLLQLPETARFNTPGTVGDNWRWRLKSNELTQELAEQLASRTREYDRCSYGAGNESGDLSNQFLTMDKAATG